MNKKYAAAAIALMAVSLNAFPQSVTINARNRSAESVFADLMKQTGKNFIYTSGLLNGVKVSIKADEKPLTKVLDEMFAGTGITYKIKGNNVLLSRAKVKSIPRHTVSGFVKEEGNGEALVGASVYDLVSGKGAVTNANGFYSLTIPDGDVNLKVQYARFDPYTSGQFKLNGNKSINFSLAQPHELEEVVVNATVNNTKSMLSTEIGSLNLTNEAIKATPVIFGESDVIKTLQLEPGISAGIEGMAGMYVHGGDTDENLFMLDNIPLYQVNHFGGLFSAFNVEAIRNVDFYKTSFPAKYDGRLSSFMDVHTKDGSLTEHHGSFRLGITSGAFDINGPIWKGRTTYSVAIRRSWYEIISIPALAIMNKISDSKNTHLRYAFTDFNVKINHNFSDRSSAYVMFYYGEDYLNSGEDDKDKNNSYFYTTDDYVQGNDRTFGSPQGSSSGNTNNEDLEKDYTDTRANLRWGNIVASAGWKYIFSPKLYGEVTGAFTRYFSSLSNKNENGVMVNDKITSYSRNTYHHENNINDLIARANFNWLPSADNKVDFGVSFVNHSFLPTKAERVLKKEGETSTVNDNVPTYHANELNFYISDDLSVGDVLRFNAGVHYSLFIIDGKTKTGLSPRFSVRVTPFHDFAIKAAYSRSTQFVHQLAESNISLPTDQWIPITGYQKPQTADKIALGAYWTTPNHQFTFSIEGYYKWMHNLLDYTDDYYLVPPTESWMEKMDIGKGKSRGIDFKVTKEFGKITGHIAYSLLWADRKFPDKNKGEWFPARFDNRHKINIALNWKINSKWDVGASWTGMSGNRITLPLQCWNDPGLGPWHFDMNFYDKTNNYRLPFYHRLDLSATRKTKNGYWTFSIYNAYSYMNVIAVRRDTSVNGGHVDSNGTYVPNEVFQHVRAIPIIPSVSYTWLF